MSKFLKYWFLILVILISTILIHCGDGVTETGNPTSVPSSEEPSSETKEFACDFCYDSTETSTTSDTDDEGVDVLVSQPLSETGTILFALCGKVNDCYEGLTEDLDCIEGVYEDENILSAFGVNTTLYQNLEEVQTAIDEESVSVNSDVLDSCETALTGLSCPDLENNDIFSEDTPSDYSSVYLIIPEEECGSIF